MRTALARAEAGLVAVNRWALIALMAAMAVLVFGNVVSRYLLSYSLIWIEELTRYMMVWVGFLGSGLVLRVGAHIAVDALQDALPEAAARMLRGLIALILGLAFATMTWLGVRYALFAWGQETPAMNWSTGAVYLAIPVGSALMLVHLLFIARRYVRAREFVKDESLSTPL